MQQPVGEVATIPTQQFQITHNWYALAVMPRHEKTVSRVLGNKGYETFLPLYARPHKYAGRTRSFEIPLFPGYIFCRFDAAVRLPILTTPGVLQVMGVGRNPVPVDEDEVVAIRRAVEAGIPLTPIPFFKVGQRGRIADGPLAGLEGIISATKPLRLVLSVSLLQRSVLIEIDSDCVKAV
jgi:transcription antitermination factor NusG